MGNSSYLIIGEEFAAHVSKKDRWRAAAGAASVAQGPQVCQPQVSLCRLLCRGQDFSVSPSWAYV